MTVTEQCIFYLASEKTFYRSIQRMTVTGIIAEYNPFHNGHQYQIDWVRKELKSDYIVVAMSGDYVQRGTPAILSKHTRAEMALLCGADLVLELPVQFSSASAEGFSTGAVSLLDGTGVVTHLCFGSESGDTGRFLLTADLLNEEPAPYRTLLKKHLREGRSYPAARSLALCEYADAFHLPVSGREIAALLSSPNNILGIEYCRAIRRLKSNIAPVTLKRTGAGYHEQDLCGDSAPSATAIRSFLKQHSAFGLLSDKIPKEALEILLSGVKANAFVEEADLDLLLHYALLSSGDTYGEFLDISPEIAARIKNRLNEYRGFVQFCDLLKTKEITRTRIQRALLHLLLGIRSAPQRVPYARVLGFRREALPLLNEIKKRGSLPLITKPANASSLISLEASAFLEENTRASNIYESILCHKSRKPFKHEYQKQLVIL